MADTRSPWAQIIAFSIAAILLYHVGLLLVFFLVPMQILYLRRGVAGYKYGVLIFLGGVVVVKGISLFTARFVNVEPMLVSLDFLLPLAFLGALYIMNVEKLGGKAGGGRTVDFATRSLAAALFGGLLSLPLLIFLVGSDTLMQVLRSQFQFAEQLLKQPAGSGPTADEMVKASIDLFLRFYLFGFFLMVYFDWYLGTQLGRRMAVRPFSREDVEGGAEASHADAVNAGAVNAAAGSPAAIRVPAYMLWILIASWGAVVAGRWVELGPAAYAVWNLALVVAFLYAMQGVGIVQHLFRVRRVSRGVRYVALLSGIALLFVPVANVLIIAGFPLLGVSETWINYRKPNRNEGSGRNGSSGRSEE
ncbi:DUF2232 domain-containing protein [Salinispira pacifica]